MNKMVSVIIPAYNAEKYIEQCVQSVVKQTYKHLEIIIINDGSKDRTLDIINTISDKDERVVIINQENKGLPAARNAGLRCYKGEYVFFLDSDDWIESNCIESLVNIRNQTNTDIVFFDYYRVFGGHKVEHHVYKKDICYCTDQADAFLLWDMRTITAWGKLYSKKCLNGIFYDENMRTAEDVDFNYRVYRNVKTAYFSHKCFLNYRIQEQSAIHGYDANVIDKFEYPLYKLASYLKTDNVIDLKAYYSFAAIAYIVICQNGVVRNDNISNLEKKREIKEISRNEWAKDLFSNIKYVSIPWSRKIIIYFSRLGIYSMMITAANVRRRLKR